MKILLINPPDDLKAFAVKIKQFVKIIEPLGLLSIAAVVREAGYDVEVLDACAQGLSVEDVKKVVTAKQPSVIGFSVLSSNGTVVYEIGHWIKSCFPDICVVLGNTHAAFYAEAYLKAHCCDCVVHGEGEEVFLQLIGVWAKKRTFEGINAVSWMNNGRCVLTTESAVVEDLSALPLPARDLVDQRYYRFQPLSAVVSGMKKVSVVKHMLTSRGCPFSCSFCVVYKKNGPRYYSLTQVVAEIKELKKRYKADYIFFWDPTFVMDRERILALCRRIKEEGLDIQWGCEGHVNCLDEELLAEMESSGCRDMAFGIESGVQRHLDGMNKGATLERIERTVQMVKKRTRINVTGMFIFGFPGETWEEALQTIEFARRLPLDMARFVPLVPFPGSSLYKALTDKGEIDTGIRENGCLDISVWQKYAGSGRGLPWVTSTLSERKIKALQEKAFWSFYMRPRQFYLQLKRLRFSVVGDLLSALKSLFS